MRRKDEVSTRVIRYEPDRRIGKHAHDETQVTLLFCGQVQETVDGQMTYVRPLDVIVKPSGTEHENAFGSCESLSLQISIPNIIANGLQSLGNGLGRWHRRRNPFLVSEFLDWAEHLGRQKENTKVTSLSARLRDMALKLSAKELPTNRRVPGWLETAMNILEQEFHQPITVNELAERCYIHPVSLTRACRQVYGETVSQRKSLLRVQHAASMLIDRRNAMAGIAVDCGFVDQSHFNRVFKSFTGRTPGQYRILTSRLAKMAN